VNQSFLSVHGADASGTGPSGFVLLIAGAVKVNKVTRLQLKILNGSPRTGSLRQSGTSVRESSHNLLNCDLTQSVPVSHTKGVWLKPSAVVVQSFHGGTVKVR
jgi:hypothetical protein